MPPVSCGLSPVSVKGGKVTTIKFQTICSRDNQAAHAKEPTIESFQLQGQAQERYFDTAVLEIRNSTSVRVLELKDIRIPRVLLPKRPEKE